MSPSGTTSQDLIASLRRDYSSQTLSKTEAPESPLDLFRRWIDQALLSKLIEPNAMSLSTIGIDGWPESRIVLLREIRDSGLVFYTNYESAKGQALDVNNRVSLLFFWDVLERQIRIQGRCQKISAADSDAYFASRPRESQIGAWASLQSSVIDSRFELDEMVAQMKEKFEDRIVPRPENWGGYIVEPSSFEFWQGRPSRLHDRIKYRISEGVWVKERLSP